MFLAIPRELKDWNWKLHFSLVVLLSLPFLLSFPAPHSKPSSLVGIFSRLALLSSSDPPPPRPLSSREFNFMWLYFPALSLPFFHSFSAWNSFPFIRGLVSLEREENRKKRGLLSYTIWRENDSYGMFVTRPHAFDLSGKSPFFKWAKLQRLLWRNDMIAKVPSVKMLGYLGREKEEAYVESQKYGRAPQTV